MPAAPRSFGLDCLRALAILMVLSCHFGLIFAMWLGAHYPNELAYSGFYGVELFFVLSGFLIGRIVLDILAEGASLRGWGIFLVRRWMRTLPLYWVVLLVLAVVWPPVEAPHGREGALLEFATLTQNLAWPMTHAWFTVSWSLSVEEWFYLLFPGALFAAAACMGRRMALPLVIGAFLVLPALLRWQITTPANWGETVSKMVLCRLDAIGFGVVAAWAWRDRRPAALRDATLLLAGSLLVAAQWSEWTRLVFASERARETLMFDMASAGFALCLPFAVSWEGGGARLAKPAVIWLSRLAYPLYLVHLSVLEITSTLSVRWRLPAAVSISGSLAATVLTAWALHRFIEQPLMARRPAQPAANQA